MVLSTYLQLLINITQIRCFYSDFLPYIGKGYIGITFCTYGLITIPHCRDEFNLVKTIFFI